LDQLKSVEQDALILQSYKLGAASLKKSLAENGLAEEMCEKTMDDLEETRDITRDIEETLSRPLEEGDDADLEAELMDLLSDDKNEGDDGGDHDESLDLPDIPQDSVEHDALMKRLEALRM